MENKKLIQFYMLEEDKSKLKSLADNDSRTVSGYLRNLIKIAILRGERDGIIRK